MNLRTVNRAVVLVLACLPNLAFADDGKVSVRGSATLMVEPDFVTISGFATAEADRAADANRQVAEIIRRVVEIAGRHGIDGDDLKTSGISLRESRQDRSCPAGLLLATQGMTLVVRNIDLVETIVDEINEAGALISNTRPGIDGLEDREQKALKIAIDNARRQAEVVAEQLGLVVGGAIEVSFNTGRTAPEFDAVGNPYAPGGTRRYIPGKISVTQSVNVVFQSNSRAED